MASSSFAKATDAKLLFSMGLNVEQMGKLLETRERFGDRSENLLDSLELSDNPPAIDTPPNHVE